MPTLTIILDTNEYIFGLTEKDRNCKRLLDQLSNFQVFIPRIILKELHNNLSGEQLNRLYKILIKTNAEITCKVVPELGNRF